MPCPRQKSTQGVRLHVLFQVHSSQALGKQSSSWIFLFFVRELLLGIWPPQKAIHHHDHVVVGRGQNDYNIVSSLLLVFLPTIHAMFPNFVHLRTLEAL